MNVINVTSILISAIKLQPNEQITGNIKQVKYYKKKDVLNVPTRNIRDIFSKFLYSIL